MWHWGRSAALTVGITIVAACGETTDPDQTNPDQVSQQMGPAGGTITSGDSNLTLTIPPGALSSDVTITIAPIGLEDLGAEWDGLDLDIEQAYRLGPDGLTFASPVTVAFETDQEPSQPGELLVDAGLLFVSSGSSIEALDSLRVEAWGDAIMMVGELAHFSIVGRTFGYIRFEATVPDQVVAEQEFDVALRVTQTRPAIMSVEYTDWSGPRIRPTQILSLQARGMPQAGENTWATTVRYVCTAPPDGTWNMSILAEVLSGGLFVTLGTYPEYSGPGDEEDDPPLTKQVACSPALRTLTVTVVGEGTVATAAPIVPVIACGPNQTCSAEYVDGTYVTMVASPAPGWNFALWTGEGCSSDAGDPRFVTAAMTANRTCEAYFFPVPPTGPAIMIYADVEFGFNADHLTLAPGNTRLLVSPRTGAGLVEINLDNLYAVFESDFHPNMCAGAPVVADDPVIGRLVFVFGVETTQGCLTQYPPLDFAVGFFNVGSSTGDVATFNGLGQYARAAFSAGVLQIQTVGAASSTDVVLTPGLTSCPRYLWIVATIAFVTTEEGTPGTSTAACAATAGLYRVDLLTGTVTGSLLIGDGLRGLAVTSDGTLAYLSDYGANAVHVVNAQTMQLIRSIPLPGGPVDIALSDDGSLLVGALYDADAVALVDLVSDMVLSTVPARGVNPTRFRSLGTNQFVMLDFGDPGAGVPSKVETIGIIQP